jgi:hypothetical protein
VREKHYWLTEKVRLKKKREQESVALVGWFATAPFTASPKQIL